MLKHWYPSPNFAPRERTIDMVIIHYTVINLEEALERLCDPAIAVSAHYLIDQAGAVTHLVREEDCAWHAGVSHWQGQTHLNQSSIGIELENPGDQPFPEAQMKTLELLLTDLTMRWKVSGTRVLGHADIAPDRKVDPGPLFNWDRLRQQGWGLPVSKAAIEAYEQRDAVALEKILTSLGYQPGNPLEWEGLPGIQVLNNTKSEN